MISAMRQEHQTGNGNLKVLKDVKYGNREARKKETTT